MELPSGDMMNEVEEEGYKYQYSAGCSSEEQGNEGETWKGVPETSETSKSKLNAGNFVRGINAWAVGVIRYSAGILDWTCNEVRKLDV